MIILALDTASRYCSAALYIDGEITAEQMLSNGLVHSRTLMPMVDGVLSGCGIAPSDVDIFACSNGPGSFTGIRIAVSTVKGLALPYGKPVVGICTLEAAAAGVFAPGRIICPILDARCGQVYAAAYKDGEAVIQPAPILLDDLLKNPELGTEPVMCGDGIKIHRATISEKMPGAVFAPPPSSYQRAAAVAWAAAVRAERGQIQSCFELDAEYMRKSQAEREYEAKHGGA